MWYDDVIGLLYCQHFPSESCAKLCTCHYERYTKTFVKHQCQGREFLVALDQPLAYRDFQEGLKECGVSYKHVFEVVQGSNTARGLSCSTFARELMDSSPSKWHVIMGKHPHQISIYSWDHDGYAASSVSMRP
jgi:hypothetical protein